MWIHLENEKIDKKKSHRRIQTWEQHCVFEGTNLLLCYVHICVGRLFWRKARLPLYSLRGRTTSRREGFSWLEWSTAPRWGRSWTVDPPCLVLASVNAPEHGRRVLAPHVKAGRVALLCQSWRHCAYGGCSPTSLHDLGMFWPSWSSSQCPLFESGVVVPLYGEWLSLVGCPLSYSRLHCPTSCGRVGGIGSGWFGASWLPIVIHIP
jgi:hypothetical protein